MRRRGTTVIELIIVLVVLALIAAATPLALPREPRVRNRSALERECKAAAVHSGEPVERADLQLVCLPDGGVMTFVVPRVSTVAQAGVTQSRSSK